MAKSRESEVHNPHAPRPGLEAAEWFIVPSQQDLMHDPLGREMLDPIPKEPPVGRAGHEDPLGKRIREFVASERYRQELRASGVETFEEANDFDVGDDDDRIYSPYEERLLDGFDQGGASAPASAAASQSDGAGGTPAPSQGGSGAQPPSAAASETPPVVSSPAAGTPGGTPQR